jgi:hypothetical protein
MKPGATQLERVIAAARAFNGTCQADWLAPVTPDGGPRITRLAARLQEAEDRLGCSFECLGRRGGTKIYRLVAGPEVPRAGDPAPDPEPPGTSAVPVAGSESTGQPALFEVPRTASHYDEEAA